MIIKTISTSRPQDTQPRNVQILRILSWFTVDFMWILGNCVSRYTVFPGPQNHVTWGLTASPNSINRHVLIRILDYFLPRLGSLYLCSLTQYIYHLPIGSILWRTTLEIQAAMWQSMAGTLEIISPTAIHFSWPCSKSFRSLGIHEKSDANLALSSLEIMELQPK